MDAANKRKLILWLQYSNFRRSCFFRRLRMLVLFDARHRQQKRLLAMLLSNENISRRYWMINHHQNWFEILWEARYNPIVENLFQKQFRMLPRTFEQVVNLVTEPLIRQDTMFREAVTIHKRVAVAVWRLATGNSYRAISKVFGINCSTVNVILLEFCTVIYVLSSQFINFPVTEDETSIMIDLFRISSDCELPQVVGCLDSTHCKIRCPDVESKADYFNRKQVYSINTQAVVGERLRFLDVATGFPGSTHDARVLRSTSLFGRAERNEILTLPIIEVQGNEIKPYIIGDGAFQPVRWIMKPYARHRNLTPEERHFNRKLSKTRSLVERAFGLLKTRWRCLLKMLEHEVKNIPFI